MKQYLVLILLIFSSCLKEKEQNDIIELRIDPSTKFNFNLSTLVENYFYVPLETHDDALISNISKIEFTEDQMIIIKDARDDSQLLLFQFDGSYHMSFNRQGNSAEEYIGIQDFVIQSDSIVVYDYDLQKIFYYNISGNFISSISSSVSRFEAFYPLQNRYLIAHTGMASHQLSVVDAQFESQKQFLPIDPIYSVSYSPLYVFHPFKNSILISPEFSDIIYKFEGDQRNPFLKFDFDDHWSSRELLTNPNKYPHEIVQETQNNDKIAFFNFIASENLLSCFYQFNNKFQQVIFNPTTDKYVILGENSDDLKIGVNNKPIGRYQDYYIYELPVMNVIDKQVDNSEIDKMDLEYDINNNPLLLFVKYNL